MQRRAFALQLLAAGAAASLTLPAQAQAEPAEGRDYNRVQPPVPVAAAGKIEVIEFFGYWCPHCNTFEPALDAWARKLPADVVFRRLPMAFSATQESLQRLYFAIESLGLIDTLHRKVFAAVHVQRTRIEKESDIAAFATANGVDPVKLVDASKSFSVATRIRQAKQTAEGFKLDGVPTLGVQGRYVTSPSLTGSSERALAVADALIRKARAG